MERTERDHRDLRLATETVERIIDKHLENERRERNRTVALTAQTITKAVQSRRKVDGILEVSTIHHYDAKCLAEALHTLAFFLQPHSEHSCSTKMYEGFDYFDAIDAPLTDSLSAICEERDWSWYHQGDPRGYPLFINFEGKPLNDQNYHRDGYAIQPIDLMA